MLFDPIKIASLQIKNRIVRSATYEKRADEDGFVTEELLSFYEALAKGGTGLIVTGFAMVHHSGRVLPKMMSIHSDRYMDGFRALADRVHKAGSKLVVQVAHGGRQSPPVFLGGESPIAPSAVPDPSSGVTPREMTNDEIWQIVEAFGEAARRARDAGCDGVQIHAAHGYLASGFLSPHTNRRDDYWGGDDERRYHFVEEVIEAMLDKAGSGFPILIKMNCDDLLPGGLNPEQSARIAVRLQADGIAAIEISGGMREAPIKTIRPGILKPEQEAYFRQAGALFKKRVSVPVILTGGMRSRAVMESVLAANEADMIGLSRPLIREPNLPELMLNGKEKADCISCNKCANFLKYEKVECLELQAKG
ncbi:MAG: NADH:flavin oxidoreductase [Actinomycetota bacterium]|nr:NADH:flavin oxidoreductase [Actinomycetota bacterium]